MSFTTFVTTMFLVMLAYKAVKISSEQIKLRLNDIFQVIVCVVIPSLCSIIFVRTIFQIWYFEPYENIFVELLPLNFCMGMLIFTVVVLVAQILGSKAGNTEYSMSVNLYIVL